MKVVGNNKEGVCNRCGSRLVLVIEKTLGSDKRIIHYIYRCTGCGIKRSAGEVTVSKINGSIKIFVSRRKSYISN